MKNKAVILYVPVIHQGYIKFLDKYKETHDILLLGEGFSQKLPVFKTYFERDVRKIDSSISNATLKCLGFSATILGVAINMDFFTNYEKIVMPDEDVSREIIETFPQYFKNTEIVSTALRYDKFILEKKFNIDPLAVISEDEFAKSVLSKAHQIAQRSPDWWRQVACIVITEHGKEISVYNDHLPLSRTANEMGDPRSNFNAGVRGDLSLAIHAETGVIAYAAKHGISLLGASMYVTTFPCPVCARVISQTGIRKIYFEEGYSSLDGKEILESNGIAIYQVKTKN